MLLNSIGIDCLESSLLEANKGRAVGHLTKGHRYCGSQLGAG